MLANLNFKLIAALLSALVAASLVLYIQWQSNKIIEAENEVQSLQTALVATQQAFDSQHSAYIDVKAKLEISERTSEQFYKSLQETNTKYKFLKEERDALKRKDDEVNNYLATPIPDALLERLYKRSN